MIDAVGELLLALRVALLNACRDAVVAPVRSIALGVTAMMGKGRPHRCAQGSERQTRQRDGELGNDGHALHGNGASLGQVQPRFARAESCVLSNSVRFGPNVRVFMHHCRSFLATIATAVVLVLAVGAAGCQSGQSPKATRDAPVPVPPAPLPVQAAVPAPAPTNPAPEAPSENANNVEWKGNVAWHTWSEALPVARSENKPILVLLYADWCPHCRALAPAFSDPQIEALSKKFVMVRQNNDDDPAWLEPYKKYGGYVPRIFFFDPKGQMREDIVSGHPRYPYFYAAEHIDLLKQSMRRVIGT
jgi:thiol-disulfide isomerase/thioredoxin